MSVTIRLARPSDAEAIADLTAQLGYDVDLTDVAARLSRILAHRDQQFFIAERDGRAAGWLHAAQSEYIETGAFVVIGGLVVDKSCRGEGVGRLLMARAEAWASERGFSVVRLSSTITRTAAHRFYESIGYRNIKTQYAFAKSLQSTADDLDRFIPRVDPGS